MLLPTLLFQARHLLLGKVNVLAFRSHMVPLFYIIMVMYTSCTVQAREEARAMRIYEYKLRAQPEQYAAVDEAIRTVQFVRNSCLRLWMDTRGTTRADLQCLCALLVQTFPLKEEPPCFQAGECQYMKDYSADVARVLSDRLGLL
jgi:hypothetical protein